MKTSTIVWTLAVLIILLGIGAYLYTETPEVTPTPEVHTPYDSNTPLPAGDMAPTPSTPIASSSTSSNVTGSTTFGR